MNSAVFLDRDGVINRPIIREGRPYPPGSIAEFEILPGVEDACQALKNAGFLLVVVTNQPDVGRGTLDRGIVEEIHQLMAGRLPLDLVLTCFHGGEQYGQPCECRKPQPGMLRQAASRLQISLPDSYMVGDRWRDIDCGKRAGCKTVFIDWGYAEYLRETPDHLAPNLEEAARIILRKNL
ncbi:MAG: HAD family hydrolase [Verrucomicrobia bacterium]|nr:HAD family hydrolase [Verrucomicrobiota bacterium]